MGRDIARRHRLTVGEWVGKTLRAARRPEPGRDSRRKLKAIRTGAERTFPAAFPTSDIRGIIAEIERGYLK
jgi:hypothetical protein